MSEEKVVSNEVEIDADAEAVWNALADGEELKRWFPLDARVTPGEGGALWLSWGEGMDWEAPISVWEPGRHIRTIDPPPSRAAVDYYVEARGGRTVLRIVQSGFGDSTWEDELDTLATGWKSFLANAKHYVERHRGEPRAMAFHRHPVVPLERRDAYPRLLRAFGFAQAPAEGERYDVTTATGLALRGAIAVSAPPIHLTGTVENLNDAYLMIEVEPGRGKCRPAAWLSLYGAACGRVAELTAVIRATLEEAFRNDA
jgi:uncharacterized protein YndB with AHSA1/START domain